MSAAAALQGDYRSQQIVAAIVVDLLQSAAAKTRLPCVRATCTGLAVLQPDISGTPLGIAHPSVARVSCRYLCAPRTAQELSVLANARRRECECDLSAPLVRELHFPEDLGIRLNNAHSAFEGVLIALATTVKISARATYGCMSLTMKRGNRAIRRGIDPIWPSGFSDIAPYGVEQSITALCDLVAYKPIAFLLDVIVALYMLNETVAYPRLLPIIINNAFVPITTHVLDEWSKRPPTSSSFQQCADVLENASQLFKSFIILDHTYLRLMVQHGIDGPTVVHVMGRVLEFYDALNANISRFPHFRLPTNKEDMMLFLMVGGGLHAALHLPWDEALYPSDRFARYDRDFAEVLENPVTRVAFWAQVLYGGKICGNSGCSGTFVSEGRKLRACAGCLHMFYCSRRCQKQAWKDPRVAHKHVCALFARLPVHVGPIPAGSAFGDAFAALVQQELASELHVAEKLSTHLCLLYSS